MNIVTTRFGTIQVPDERLILIPEGLVGFRSYTQFAHWVDPEVDELTWLQSVSEPSLAFALMLPPASAGEYRVEIRPGDRIALELEDERNAIVYVILNRGEGGLTVNLQGPLVINPVRRLGRQLVLTSSRYAVRYPLGTPDAPPTLLPGPVALRATA